MCLFKKKQASLEARTRLCLKQLTARSDFATTKYTVNKIIKVSDPATGLKVGERKVLYATTVYIKAGIDFDRFSFQNVLIDKQNKGIAITLPKAKVFSLDMPSLKREKVYERIGWLRRRFHAGEMSELFKQGEKAVMQDLEKIGILEEAERSARSIFKAALLQLGYETVSISFN